MALEFMLPVLTPRSVTLSDGSLSCSWAADSSRTFSFSGSLPMCQWPSVSVVLPQGHGGSNAHIVADPIAVLPGIFRYGYAAPFYNVGQAVRTILFGTKSHRMSIPCCFDCRTLILHITQLV